MLPYVSTCDQCMLVLKLWLEELCLLSASWQYLFLNSPRRRDVNCRRGLWLPCVVSSGARSGLSSNKVWEESDGYSPTRFASITRSLRIS